MSDVTEESTGAESAPQENTDEPNIPGLIITEGSVPAVNDRWDAVTIHADAVQGAMLGPWDCKITFIEHFLMDDGKGLQGRYVCNLVMPTPQLRAMGDLFTRLADELDKAMKNG